MTREDAIFYIKELQKTYASMDKKVAEGVAMAIEALTHAERTETHSCVSETHGDLISREAAIAAITEEMSEAWTESDADYNRGMEMAASIIEALPSADTDMSDYSDRLWKAAYERGKAEKHQLSAEKHQLANDLISRQAATNAIHKYFCDEIEKTPHEIDEDGFDVYTDMQTVNSLLTCNKQLSKQIKALPSADAADVVRCKDCRYRGLDGEVTHYYWCRINERPVDDTDYCAWGMESEVEE